MRNRLILAALLMCAAPAGAFAQGANNTVQGFGGLTFATSSSFLGNTSTSSSFGGVVTAGITPNVVVVGEFGRLTDIKPPLFDLLDYTPADLRVSAWHGEGGVRFIASPRLAVRPYAEATAGFARLNTSLSGLGDRNDEILDAALPFLNKTEPLLGVGGGVLLSTGPLAVDIGYRFKKIRASGVDSFLSAGDGYQVNEVRFGVGVRF
jgi:hypothetical protein